MADAIRRLIWFFFVSGAVSYAFFLVAGSAIASRAVEDSRAVLARDSIRVNVHYLSGMVMVPSTCAELTVRTRQLSIDTYELQFSTWEEPSLAHCSREDTPRSFRAIVFAPSAGIHFQAMLDEKPIQFEVIQVVERS
jgi:hypothetical protein